MNLIQSTFLCLMCALSLFAVAAMPQSALGFFDSATAAGSNTFIAGTLGIVVAPTTGLTAVIEPSATSEVNFTLTNTGTIDPLFTLTATKDDSCAATFFDSVEIQVVKDGVLFDGSLAYLTATSSVDGEWQLQISAGENLVASENEACTVTLEVQASQNNLMSTGGFSAEATMSLTLTAGADMPGDMMASAVVLNEIYPNQTETADAPLDQEWVELYNGTEAAVDVEGWALGELAGSSGNETRHVISAHNTCAEGSKIGFARPYDGANTVIPPGGRLLVEFCVTNLLNNNGDTVLLYDDTLQRIDEHTYPATAKGKSHQRVPDGGVWVDPTPTPGTANVVSESELQAAGLSPAMISYILKLQMAQEAVSTEEKAFTFVTAATSSSSTVATRDEVSETSQSTDSATVTDESIGDGAEAATTTAEKTATSSEPMATSSSPHSTSIFSTTTSATSSDESMPQTDPSGDESSTLLTDEPETIREEVEPIVSVKKSSDQEEATEESADTSQTSPPLESTEETKKEVREGVNPGVAVEVPKTAAPSPEVTEESNSSSHETD